MTFWNIGKKIAITTDNLKEWKKPDIFAKFRKIELMHHVAIELQVTTTFIDVVVSRQDFYRRDKSYIIWIFNDFSTNRKDQRMMQLDIVVSNCMNAFVVNENTIQKSHQNNDLVLLCYYKTYELIDGQIEARWNNEFVTLNDLTFDKDFKVYYYNSEKEFLELEAEVADQDLIIERIGRDKQLVEEKVLILVSEIRKIYKVKKHKDIPYWLISHLNELDGFEKKLLNEKLQFATTNIDFIYDLALIKNKLVFFKFLLSTDAIEIDLNSFPKTKGSLLIEFLEKYNDENLASTILLFVRNGYILSSIDNNYVVEKCPVRYVNEKGDIENYFTNLVIELKEEEYISQLLSDYKLKQFILAILSVKYNNLIGWEFNNLRSLANQIFYSYRDYSLLFYQALLYYGRLENMIKEDSLKNGKFRNKLKLFEEENIISIKNESLLKIVFPELF